MSQAIPDRQKQISKSGLSLVELLIAMALMGFVSLSISNFLIRGNVSSNSLSMRFKEANEIHTVISDLQQDLRKGAYISNNSHNNRLEYTTYDSSGNASKKIYRIVTTSGKKYLELSTDGGSTWISPYRISASTKYQLTGTPRFLYAGSINNCTDFPDTNGNGVWGTGDNAGTYTAADCPTGAAPALNKPSEATKVLLKNFAFSTGTGSPEAIRSLPSSIYIAVPNGLVRSATAPASPAVVDSPLVQSFSVTTNLNASLLPYAVEYDPARDRLLIGGNGVTRIFLTDRRGIQMGSSLALSDSTIIIRSIAMENDGKTILLLDQQTKKVYRYDITGSTPLTPITTLNLASPTNLINTPRSIAFDPYTPNDYYIIGENPSTAQVYIYQRNKTTNALVASWAMPSGLFFDGLTIEPISGDFLTILDNITGSSPNKVLTIYRINRSTSAASTITFNADNLGSTASGTTAVMGLSYDTATNRFFMTNNPDNKVFEFVPDKLISPRT
jgi:hypothetical protein